MVVQGSGHYKKIHMGVESLLQQRFTITKIVKSEQFFKKQKFMV